MQIVDFSLLLLLLLLGCRTLLLHSVLDSLCVCRSSLKVGSACLQGRQLLLQLLARLLCPGPVLLRTAAGFNRLLLGSGSVVELQLQVADFRLAGLDALPEIPRGGGRLFRSLLFRLLLLLQLQLGSGKPVLQVGSCLFCCREIAVAVATLLLQGARTLLLLLELTLQLCHSCAKRNDLQFKLREERA